MPLDSIDGYGVALVLRSEHPEVKAGQYVYGRNIRESHSATRLVSRFSSPVSIAAHQEYTVMANMENRSVLEKDPKLPWTVYVGAAGMPGSIKLPMFDELCS